MNILVIGLNHKTADVEIREKFSFPEASLTEALLSLRNFSQIDECIILSTCNRVEIYAWVKDKDAGIEEIKSFLSGYHDIRREDFEDALYIYNDATAVRHIFRVASSLDSMVVGEPQILGQMKDAFERALEAKTSGVILNRLMKKAISVAKRVRTDTKIAENAVSISFAAVELAKGIFEDLSSKVVMLMGAGDMAELAARHLVKNGVKAVLVVNRTYERAVELADAFKGKAVAFDNLFSEMVDSDIIICSTGASHYIVNPDDMRVVMKTRRNKPIFIIDISVPRNVNPAVNEMDNVYLYNIDDLQGVVDLNLKGRQKEADAAEQIVVEEVETFLAWMNSLDAIPTIVELKDKIESIRKAELGKTLSKLNGIGEKETKAIEELSNSIVKKILHTPLIALKVDIEPEEKTFYLDIVRRLFNLDRTLPHRYHREKLQSPTDETKDKESEK
ncbi:MAG: glutamyl-tRNA reductase [Nitrospirota bacterium]